MYFQRNPSEQPFLFWLIEELFSRDESLEAETMPISNREFYTWMTLIGGALLVYAVVFRLVGE